MERIRLVTAAALFDGHDVSINIFRRLLQKRGAEVIHLGHNRSVGEVVSAALSEDADAALISSYQGGHNEYFRYAVDSLREAGAGDKLVFGGGGGVILPAEIEELEKAGVERIYHASDGMTLGIDGIADDIINRIATRKKVREAESQYDITGEIIRNNSAQDHYSLARQISVIEKHGEDEERIAAYRELYLRNDMQKSFVVGVTGTGGGGKSSLIDELIGRFLSTTENVSIAVLAVDPTKSKTGGALLGDRIRYNHIFSPRVFFRSFATRESGSELSRAVRDSINVLKSAGFDIIFVETSGIGQGDSRVADIADCSVYVMTSEFGAPSQLEKIDMLDRADFTVINKFEKIGSEDALREVIIHHIRSRGIKPKQGEPLESLPLPVYAASSAQFNNPGVNKLFRDMLQRLEEERGGDYGAKRDMIELMPTELGGKFGLIDGARLNYLGEIADTVRNYKKKAAEESRKAELAQALAISMEALQDTPAKEHLADAFGKGFSALAPETRAALESWKDKKENYTADKIAYSIQGRELTMPGYSETLCGTSIPKVALPPFSSWAELVKFLFLENLPGEFPYTAGVFPFKRTTEEPRRQFAGEGSPERTNKRFHFLSREDRAKRLSVAFDGITLYGEDPAERPDIYGKIGESGVSVCTLDDMEELLKGFDLMDPYTSVSMTINAPAPIMVAFFFITAYNRELAKRENGAPISQEEKDKLKLEIFRNIRGTVQADMLKEDQGQNTCIFSIDFAMKLIGDLQEFLSVNQIKNYYSLSISGYHIAEAGANPITQLAFTLANGFTYVEYFLQRGMKIDDFAPNLSFFFSNGMDPEYSVIGRVARRIWAVAMRDRYGASEKSQKLKYHIQTSGRSLHAQEIEFNDIRTTLQGLIALADNCNSLHTNSYDEAVTTPTEESVRRSMAIQMILMHEFGTLKNENPNQGSFYVEALTDLVEEAVLEEFNAISRRGGVMAAMERQYQRSKIQEQSLYYESLKQSGDYPIIGVNKFVASNGQNNYDKMEITRASAEEKNARLATLAEYKRRHAERSAEALERLRKVALAGGNVFEELLSTVESATMGEITATLYEIGGKYRRGM